MCVATMQTIGTYSALAKNEKRLACLERDTLEKTVT